MKKSILAACLAFGISACDAPSENIVINTETTSKVSSINMMRAIPETTASQAVSAVAKFCGVGKEINVSKVEAGLKSAGYLQLAEARDKNFNVWVKNEVAPVFGTGDQEGVKMCFVLLPKAEAKRAKIEPLLRSKIDSDAFAIPQEFVKSTPAIGMWSSSVDNRFLYMIIAEKGNYGFAYASN